jgi:hypothetical protein
MSEVESNISEGHRIRTAISPSDANVTVNNGHRLSSRVLLCGISKIQFWKPLLHEEPAQLRIRIRLCGGAYQLVAEHTRHPGLDVLGDHRRRADELTIDEGRGAWHIRRDTKRAELGFRGAANRRSFGCGRRRR